MDMQKKLLTTHYTREKVQEIMNCCGGLQQFSGITSHSLHVMRRWAATLDAQLADLAKDYTDDSAYDHIFFNLGGWKPEWLESKQCLHTNKGLFFISVGQQAIIKHGSPMIATYHYRLKLGDPNNEPTEAYELEKLRPLAEKYMERFVDSLPEQSIQQFNALFREKDIPEVHKTLRQPS